MNMRTLTQLIGCIALGILIGLGWWLCDGGQTCNKASDCPGGVFNAQEMASAKVYQGKWHSDYLEVIK